MRLASFHHRSGARQFRSRPRRRTGAGFSEVAPEDLSLPALRLAAGRVVGQVERVTGPTRQGGVVQLGRVTGQNYLALYGTARVDELAVIGLAHLVAAG